MKGRINGVVKDLKCYIMEVWHDNFDDPIQRSGDIAWAKIRMYGLFATPFKTWVGCNQWRKTNLSDDGKSEGKAVHIYSEKYLFHEYNLSAGYRDLCPTSCLVMEQGLSGCAVRLHFQLFSPALIIHADMRKRQKCPWNRYYEEDVPHFPWLCSSQYKQ